jgi:hypothetical protein
MAALAVLLAGNGAALAQDKATPKDLPSFGALRGVSLEQARAQAQDWLKSVGKTDEATTQEFSKIWDDKAETPVIDRVSQTLTLGSAAASKLLAEARDPNAPPPTQVPELLKDAKQSTFFRANLALAYARALSNRRVYEEALDSLKAIRVEQVVDPASFLFHKAVCEYSTAAAESTKQPQRKKEVEGTIIRLLDDVVDAPERYKMVAALMHFDMMTWKDKDLGAIARKMDNVERRLELARGGPETQKQQKEIVDRLDELIKQLENQQKQQGGGGGNGGQCPEGGQGNQQGQPGNNTRSSSPQDDSRGGNGTGPGLVDPKKFKELAEVWGKLPEKERAAAMRELTKGAPPQYRELVENYFKKLAQSDPGK